MSDSKPKIMSVNDKNMEIHTEKWTRMRMKKAFLKARDRRKNFERGELAGFVYCVALASIVVAASGQLNHVELNTWQRIAIGAIGIAALATKTIIKRRFWRQTEDAEYKDKENGDRRHQRTTTED